MNLKERLLAAAGYQARSTPLELLCRHGTAAAPRLSVVIPTRNRPGHAVRTVGSVLRCDVPWQYEVIVIDQSDGDQTAIALRAFDGDDRLTCVRSATSSLAAARNEGAARARAEIIAIAQDGCTVPGDWLARLQAAFLAHPRVGLAVGHVARIPDGAGAGAIPALRHGLSRVITRPGASAGAVGIGACLAVRKTAFDAVGGFDEALCQDGRFLSAGTHGLALRLLLGGWFVLETPRLFVVDHDVHTLDQVRALARTDSAAVGVVHARLLRSGWRRMVPVIGCALTVPVASLLGGRRPPVRRHPLPYLQGFIRALRGPKDPAPRCSSGKLTGSEPGARQ